MSSFKGLWAIWCSSYQALSCLFSLTVRYVRSAALYYTSRRAIINKSEFESGSCDQWLSSVRIHTSMSCKPGSRDQKVKPDLVPRKYSPCKVRHTMRYLAETAICRVELSVMQSKKGCNVCKSCTFQHMHSFAKSRRSSSCSLQQAGPPTHF